MSSGEKVLVSEKIYQKLCTMIVAHRYSPGLRINVEQLTRELGASRGSVWEAIRRLEQEGILQNIPNRGVFMAKNSLERAIEQWEVQGALYRLASKLACERVTRRLIERLSRCLKDQLSAIDTADLKAYSTADDQFHRLICEASGNSYLVELFDSFTLHLRGLPADANIATILSSLPSIYLTHQEITEGLAAEDPVRVDEAIVRHGEIVISNLKQSLIAARARKDMVRQINKSGLVNKPQAKRGRRPVKTEESEAEAEAETWIEGRVTQND